MEDDMEQRVHDLENAQSSLQAQLDAKTARVNELEASNSQLQGRLEQTSDNLEREKAEKEAAREGANEAAREREQKETAIRTVDELRRAATKQEEAYDALDMELESLRGKLRQAERARGDALDEAELKTRELASVNRRAAGLQNQCADLEKELDERTKALSTYRGEKTQELMKAMSQLAEATRRAEAAEDETAAVQRTADSLQARLTRAENELKAVLEQSVVDRAGLERQMALQANLTNLQKQKADEAMIKIEHLRAEITRLEGRVAAEMDKTAKERKRADDVRDKSKAVVEELKANLEKEAAAKKNEDNAWSTTHSRGANGHGLEAQPVSLDLSIDLNNLTEDELKTRMMRMERELETVRSERDRHALFLTRILREVDHKSPLLMNSKKDYQRVLQSHEQLFLKVEDSMRRCQKAEVEKEKALSRRNSLALELETAKDSLADLGAQVQRLLTAKLERDLGRPLERTSNRNGPMAIKSGEDMAIVAAGGNVVSHEPEQVIADHLVTFEDVRQMQERNRMLVQVVRRMTAELKDTKTARNMENDAHQAKVVEELQQELDELREARKRQLEMLETVTSARDMYRLLLAQETSKDMQEGAGANGGGGSSRSSIAAAQELEATKSRVHELERDLGVARDEIRKLQETLKHLAEDVTAAERAQSKAQAELAATQRMLSHSEDRLKGLVEDRDMRTSTIVRETEKFQKLSDNVVKLQGHLERQKDEAVAAQNEAKDLALTNQALRADKRIIEEAERRLRDENMALRKEARHKDTLLDNLASRDRSVGVHKDAEISTLRDELNRLRRQAENDRRAAMEADMAKQKAVAELRDAQRELQTMRSTLEAEAASAKAAAEKAVEAERAASKRSVELAARLQEARARLLMGGGKGDGGEDGGSGGGVDVSEEGMSSQLAEIRKLGLALEATKAELKAKEGALATSERQRVQYEAIGKSRQQQMVQITAAKKKMEEELSARAKEAEARAATAEAEVRSTKTGLASTVADLVREKEDSERESAAAQQMLMRLKDELETVRRQVELERSRADDSKKETEVQQKAARAAEERYRHELEAHAGAITALRQAEDTQDQLVSEKRDAVNAKDALAADLMRARAEWEAREASLKKDYEDAKERLARSKSENEVLHEHLQTLNQQLEADEKKRQAADKAMAESVVGGDADSGAGDDSERLRLARSVKELHELVRYKQRDIQVVTMNLEMSTQKVSTLEAELDRAKISLREVREEVQKVARDSVDAVSKTEHRKLLDEVAQVSTLRESNIMLRNSLREAEDRSRLAEARVKDLERKSAPLQQAERRQAAAAAALASDKASLRREVDNWKKRVASLTASFNAVDPKEHDEVVAENNKLQKSLAEEERAKAALENSKAELMRAKAAAEKQRDDVNAVKSRLTNQVSEMRKTLEGVRREAASQKATATRDLEAKLSAEKEKASKAAAEALSAKQDLARARNGATVAVKQLNDQLAKAKAETEALRFQMRQPHHSKADGASQEAALRKKISELEKEKDALERESTTNRNMYDKMKTVNRNMKENLEKFRQQVRDKEDRIAKLQARASELEEGAVPQSAPSSLAPAPAPSSSTSTSPSFGATAAPSADASASAGRPQTRSVSPGPPGGRSDLSAAPMAVDEGKGEGADGGESALRNKLMARSKRPFAPASETPAPAKRAHTVADEPTSSATHPVSTSATTTEPTFVSGDTPPPPAPSDPLSTTVSNTTVVGAPSTFWSTIPTKPAFSSSVSAIAPSKNSSSSGGAPSAASAPTPSASGLNPSAHPFGVDAGGWAGTRRPGAGTVSPPSSSPAPASASPSPAAPFGDMIGWGDRRRPAASIPASSTVVLQSPVAAATPAAPTASAGGGAPGGADAGGASRASGEGQGGVGGTQPGKKDAPSAASGVFGSGKGFTGFGGGGRFGDTNVASMKPPSKDAQFQIFPKINLPVPSGTKSSSAGAPFPPPPGASGATPAFNAPGKPAAGNSGAGITLQQPQQQKQQQSPFGSGSVGQGKFGLGSAPSPSFGSGIPAFGSGIPAFGSGVSAFNSGAPSFGKPAASASASSPFQATATITSNTTTAAAAASVPDNGGEAFTSSSGVGSRIKAGASSGGVGADVVPTGTADSAEAAAAGMPGPGALMLDVEARRAAREKRFAVQPSASAAGSNQVTSTVPAASAAAASSAPGTGTASATVSKAGESDGTKNAAQFHEEDEDEEDGEIDEEDEGDPV